MYHSEFVPKFSSKQDRSSSLLQTGITVSEWLPVVSGIKKVYKDKVRPVEELYRLSDFGCPPLDESEIDAKPMVLLLGQYSTGKTTFIQHMIGRDIPGSYVGPEPTTDRFMAVMYGPEDRVTPGAAVSVQAEKPFRGLARFGTSFLSKFETCEVAVPMLESISFVDTPGVLSGEKQTIGRSYNFAAVTRWFAEKSDLILILFDANKLDISDEFRSALEALHGHDDKIRVVLNKADTVTSQQLMRVYGALMWYLGKVIKTPEVVRVYMGSFWDRPCQNPELQHLFAEEQADIMRDLRNLPRNAAVRKLNDMVKRVRQVLMFSVLLSTLRDEMPLLFGKDSKKVELMSNLPSIYQKVQQATQIPLGDFPEIGVLKQQLSTQDFTKFPKIDKKLQALLQEALNTDLSNLMKFVPKADDAPPKYLEPSPAPPPAPSHEDSRRPSVHSSASFRQAASAAAPAASTGPAVVGPSLAYVVPGGSAAECKTVTIVTKGKNKIKAFRLEGSSLADPADWSDFVQLAQEKVSAPSENLLVKDMGPEGRSLTRHVYDSRHVAKVRHVIDEMSLPNGPPVVVTAFTVTSSGPADSVLAFRSGGSESDWWDPAPMGEQECVTSPAGVQAGSARVAHLDFADSAYDADIVLPSKRSSFLPVVDVDTVVADSYGNCFPVYYTVDHQGVAEGVLRVKLRLGSQLDAKVTDTPFVRIRWIALCTTF